MRLLIVEDDRDAADYLVKAFREVGHVAEHAADGEEGFELALDGSYDVLIVDRMLPKRDGLSVIGALRAKSVATPVLILSARDSDSDKVEGFRAKDGSNNASGGNVTFADGRKVFAGAAEDVVPQE